MLPWCVRSSLRDYQVRVRWCSSAVISKLIHLVLLFTGHFPLCVFITTVPSCHPFVSLRLLHYQSSSLSSGQSHLSFVHRRAQPADRSPDGFVLLCRRQSACLVTKSDRRRKQGHPVAGRPLFKLLSTLVLLGASCIGTPSSPSFPNRHPRRQHLPTSRVAAVVDHCASHKSCAGSGHGRTARSSFFFFSYSLQPPSVVVLDVGVALHCVVHLHRSGVVVGVSSWSRANFPE